MASFVLLVVASAVLSGLSSASRASGATKARSTAASLASRIRSARAPWAHSSGELQEVRPRALGRRTGPEVHVAPPVRGPLSRLRRAQATLGGRPLKLRRRGGRLVGRVDLRPNGRSTVVLKVTGRGARGRPVTRTRRYHPCS